MVDFLFRKSRTQHAAKNCFEFVSECVLIQGAEISFSYFILYHFLHLFSVDDSLLCLSLYLLVFLVCATVSFLHGAHSIHSYPSPIPHDNNNKSILFLFLINTHKNQAAYSDTFRFYQYVNRIFFSRIVPLQANTNISNSMLCCFCCWIYIFSFLHVSCRMLLFCIYLIRTIQHNFRYTPTTILTTSQYTLKRAHQFQCIFSFVSFNFFCFDVFFCIKETTTLCIISFLFY